MPTANASFRITFPIEKAERRDSGLFLTGLASGPEIDSTGERMDKGLIHQFAEQINARGGLPLDDKLVYRDAHAPDGVLRDLGWVTKAWVNENAQLGVEVRLDEDNPASMYLWRSITERGKKFGMSVAGKVWDFVDEFVADVGEVVRTYTDVVLTEISNTTRPAWTPSFGSVLSKAIDEAAEAESLHERNLMNEEELKQETTEASATEKDAEEQATEAATEETTEKTDETTEPEKEEEVEKAGKKVSAATGAKLVGIYNEWGATLRELGLIEGETTETPSDDPAEKSDSATDEETIEKTEEKSATDLQGEIDELVRSKAELTAKVEELEKRPLTQLPPVLEKAEAREEFEKALSELPMDARMRVAFAALTGGK